MAAMQQAVVSLEQKPPMAEDRGVLYTAADAGYHSRDQMVQDQFNKMVFLYQAFLAMLVAFAAWAQSSAGPDRAVATALAPWVALVLEASGLLCLLAMHLDLCSNLSSKYAVQDYLKSWERGTPDPGGPWTAIIERGRYAEESLKHVLSGDRAGLQRALRGPTARRGPFVIVSRLLLFLWVLTSAAVSGWLATLG